MNRIALQCENLKYTCETTSRNHNQRIVIEEFSKFESENPNLGIRI